MKINISTLAHVLNADTSGAAVLLDRDVTKAITDSRALLTPGDTVFFAIKTRIGDGHEYIENLYARGVRVFVVDKGYDIPAVCSEAIFLLTESVQTALLQSGAYIRSQLTSPLIAITGSRGKTVVKEMLNAMACPVMTVSRSPRSWNSQTGVPLSLWEAAPDSGLYIFEAGTSRSGEMEALANVLRPTIGIFTTLTPEHAEGFGSEQQKCAEKLGLFASATDIIYIASDPAVDALMWQMYADRHLHPCHDYAEICRTAASLLGIGDEHVEQALKFDRISDRIDFTDSSQNGVLAYDEFTCDLTGISTALDIIRRRTALDHRTYAIVADLLCTPATEGQTYAKFFETLRHYGIDTLYAVGPIISRHARENRTALRCRCYGDTAEFIAAVHTLDLYNATIYINGSMDHPLRDIERRLSNGRNVTRMEISLANLAHNFNYYRSIVPPTTSLIGMIKADAYGCGSVEVARTLQAHGAAMAAVAVVDEGVSLRRAGITMPILVLDPWCENLRAIFAYDLEPTLIQLDEKLLCLLEENASAEGRDTVPLHIKLDTGMHRVGLNEDELPALFNMLDRHPRIRIASVFSHLATADCLDLDEYTHMQLDRFRRMTDTIRAHIPYPVRRHILNTAGMYRFGREHVYEMARLGIGLYGISPFSDGGREDLRPVARLVTRIISRRRLPAGACVGYGCRGRLTRSSVIATIPVGYADGIDRRLGNGNAWFLVGDTRCPTVGNICMDLCMIDVTDVTDPTDDHVTIFGEDAPIARLADTLGTIPYEVLASVSPRVKRVYYRQ